MTSKGRPTSSDTSMRFITRMQDALWRVWIVFGTFDSGQIYFSDKQYGSRDKACQAAKKHRDKLVKKHNIPLRIYDGNGFNISHSKNTSGTVGIGLQIDRRRDPASISWRSTTMINGRQSPVARSIRRYGYTQAWQMVAKIREQHTGIRVSKTPPPPTPELLEWAAQTGFDLYPKKSAWPFTT